MTSAAGQLLGRDAELEQLWATAAPQLIVSSWLSTRRPLAAASSQAGGLGVEPLDDEQAGRAACGGDLLWVIAGAAHGMSSTRERSWRGTRSAARLS
jgi:hypothetical protein